MTKYFNFLLVFFLVFISASCVTRVSYSRMKPAEINMANARNIAVFYMEKKRGKTTRELKHPLWDMIEILSHESSPYMDESLEKRIARYATMRLTQALANTNYFKIIDPETVKQLVATRNLTNQAKSEIGAMLGVDAVIVGSIMNMHTVDKVETSVERQVDANGAVMAVSVKYIVRKYYFSMNYRVQRTSNGSVVTSRLFRKETSDRELLEDKDNLRNEEEVYYSFINSIVNQIKKQIAPYPIWERRSLLRDKTKDPRLEQANEFVKASLYDKALEIYLDVWKNSRNEVAGYNASIMYELQRELGNALKVMDQLIDYYPDKKYMKRIALLRVISQQEFEVTQQYNK